MSFWDPFNVFDPGKGYRAAGKEIKKGYEQGQGYLDPYNQAGRGQINKLTGAQDRLMDPAALQNEWAKGYETSPYAKQLQEQAKSSGMDAASSQGLLGSSSAINAAQQGSSNIMNADRQNYMNDLMTKYMGGIGIGQNMFNQGAGTANQMSQNANQFGQNMAGVKFGENNAMMNQLMNMFKMYQASQGGGM
ncbi:MAG TPA: hypothetical protein VN763_10650 [Saprospiraceae bacterium]|nr:hypothetical protein [Saprospiraceae bacterium]